MGDTAGKMRTLPGQWPPIRTAWWTYFPIRRRLAPSTEGFGDFLGLTDAGVLKTKLLTWLRSEDAGETWTAAITPTDHPALTDYAIATDSLLPGLLVASTTTKGIPSDRRYASADQGRTWKTTTCPGDLAGVCPRFVVQNAFGAGSNYGFYADGVRGFQGTRPAAGILPISRALPVPISHLIGVFAGRSAGDPVYLLVKGSPGHQLFRSLDGGSTWQALGGDLLPNEAPPSAVPGALLVKATAE